MVMTHFAERLLATVYGVSRSRVHVIPHGVPEVPYEREEPTKPVWDSPAGGSSAPSASSIAARAWST